MSNDEPCLWALLWSKSQNAIHIEPLQRTLSLNREAYRDNRAIDYLTLVVGSREDVEAAADLCRYTLSSRQKEGCTV